ncbi:Dihydroneopterin aldolase [Rickettsiales bacterium Ac37b]|nr:Dihydroneopterin aldolase [Rickettsiales bacterium Ac37b]
MVNSSNLFVNSAIGPILSFDKLSIKVNLGVSDIERKISQEIYLSLKLIFITPPKGCFSDNIEDTICYNQLANVIKEFCENREFKLIEYLTYQLYQSIKDFINNSNVKIWLKLDKYPGVIKDLLGATSFTYHD